MPVSERGYGSAVSERREFMNEDLICPYCGAIQETHEPDPISADMCWTQCEKCGKDFWYSVSVTRDYDSWEEDEE